MRGWFNIKKNYFCGFEFSDFPACGGETHGFEFSDFPAGGGEICGLNKNKSSFYPMIFSICFSSAFGRSFRKCSKISSFDSPGSLL